MNIDIKSAIKRLLVVAFFVGIYWRLGSTSSRMTQGYILLIHGFVALCCGLFVILKSRNHLRVDPLQKILMGLVVFCWAVAEFGWALNYYIYDFSSRLPLVVATTQTGYSASFIAGILSILISIKKPIKKIFTSKIFWASVFLTMPIVLRLVLDPFLTSKDQEILTSFNFGEAISILSSFMLLNLAITTLISTRNLNWSVYCSGLICLILADWILRVEKIFGVKPSIGVGSAMILFGLYSTFISFIGKKIEFGKIRAFSSRSLVANYKVGTFAIALVSLTIMSLTQSEPLDSVKTMAIGMGLTTFLAVFVAHHLNNKVELVSQQLGEALSIEIGMNVENIQHSISESLPEELVEPYQRIFSRIVKDEQSREENRIDKEMVNIQRQVAHDIRSPLSALNMVASFSHELPEDKRRLVRSAVRSVTDIANQLASRNVERGDAVTGSQNSFPYLIPSVVDSLVSEKRMQYRDRNSVSIEYEVKNDSYDVFSLINSTEFKRVLSNLINNAVESFDVGGEVCITVDSNDSEVMISVKDNGKGMPEEIKGKLFKEQISFGKSGGSGLGLSHAYNTICGFGGKLEFESKPGMGTTISIVIPKTEPPSWFVSALVFDGCKYLVILDDDDSIHQIWRERIGDHLKRVHLNLVQDFQKWLAENPDKLSFSLFLIDYELLGTDKKGTDIIMESDLRERAVLVTSYFEEQNVITVCEKNGIRMLPKYLAGFTKLNGLTKNTDSKVYDYILIDDKSMVRKTWEMGGKIANKKVATYSCVDEFMKDADLLNKDTSIYIDSDLGEGNRGEVLSEKIYNKGFKKIFLTTGFGKNDFANIPWITDIVDKDPPFLRR